MSGTQEILAEELRRLDSIIGVLSRQQLGLADSRFSDPNVQIQMLRILERMYQRLRVVAADLASVTT